MLELESIARIEVSSGYFNIWINPNYLLKISIPQILENNQLSHKATGRTLLINSFKFLPKPILLEEHRQFSIINNLSNLLSKFESDCPVALHFVRSESHWLNYFKYIKAENLQKLVDIENWEAFEAFDTKELEGIKLTNEELKEFDEFKNSVFNKYYDLGLVNNSGEVCYLDDKYSSNHLDSIIKYLESNGNLEVMNGVTRLDLSNQNFNWPALLDEERNSTGIMNQYLRLISNLQGSNYTRIIWAFPIKDELVANQLRCLIKLTKPVLAEILGSDSDLLNNITWYPFGTSELSTPDKLKLDSVEFDPLFTKVFTNMKQIIEEDTLKLEELAHFQIALEKVYNLDNLQTGTHSTDLIEQTSKKLATSNLKVKLLALQSKKGLKLSIEDLLTSKGLSGIYFQYTYARLCGIARKSPLTPSSQANFSLIVEQEAHQLALVLSDYPQVLLDAYKKLELQPLTNYAFKVSKELSNCNRILRVKGMREDLALARFTLLHCVRLTLESLFDLMGIEGVEKM